MKKSRLALLLSSLVYPGTGQLAQRRWAAAAVFGVSVTIALVFFLAYATIIVREFYRFAFEFETYELPPLPFKRMLAAFFVTLLIYIAGIFDTARANRRIAKEDQPA